jgi:hypothetical protein
MLAYLNLTINILYARLTHITILSFVESYNFLQKNIVKSLNFNTDNAVVLLHFSS